MTPERARYLIENKTRFGSLKMSFRKYTFERHSPTYPDGITPEEDAEIIKRWLTMKPTTCYYDALCSIMRGDNANKTQEDA